MWKGGYLEKSRIVGCLEEFVGGGEGWGVGVGCVVSQ